MENTRTLKELYETLLKRYENSNFYYVCNLINFMGSTGELSGIEHEILITDFKSQRPSKELHSEFFYHPTYDKINNLSSWWYYDIDGEQRTEVISEKVKLIKKLIDLNSK